MTGVVVISTTAANADEAQRIADALVSERLAACVQALPIQSTYAWEGEVKREAETLLLIKTRAPLQQAVESRIRALHSYATPEVIAVPVSFGSMAYLNWIDESTGGSAP